MILSIAIGHLEQTLRQSGHCHPVVLTGGGKRLRVVDEERGQVDRSWYSWYVPLTCTISKYYLYLTYFGNIPKHNICYNSSRVAHPYHSFFLSLPYLWFSQLFFPSFDHSDTLSPCHLGTSSLQWLVDHHIPWSPCPVMSLYPGIPHTPHPSLAIGLSRTQGTPFPFVYPIPLPCTFHPSPWSSQTTLWPIPSPLGLVCA